MASIAPEEAAEHFGWASMTGLIEPVGLGIGQEKNDIVR